ncbi:MAG: glycosyltransferase family 4 protein [Candidatus Krumholzibacteriota bacterium]|nr:glycosyltransferase family 4 protein [Candidatus Krumholzibacteriota bacterium]
MEPRRVLVLGPAPPPIGGDTVSTRYLLRSRYWAENGFALDHVDTSGGGAVRLTHDPLSARDLVRGLRILARFLRRLPAADVVLFWGNSRFLCTLGVPVIHACRLLRRPVVVKPFGSFLPERLRGMPAPWRAVARGALRRADALLPETEDLAVELAGLLEIDRARLTVYPNVVPDDAFAADFDPGRFGGRCVFVGQVKREKGIFDILAAIGGRTDLSCDVWGQLAPRDAKEFLRAVERLPNAAYRGETEPGEAAATIAGYDALLLPTYHEGEGNPAVLLEAFAAGVPVVASRWKNLPVLVGEEERGLLVPPRDPAAIAAALDRYRDEPGLYRAVALAARAWAERFSERVVIGGLLVGLVCELIGRPTN